MNDKFLSALGLSKKAGKAILGTELVRDALRRGKPKLVIIACDVSDATYKRLSGCAEYYGTEYIKVPYGMSSLSAACGLKKSVSAAAVTDVNFVKLIKGCLDM